MEYEKPQLESEEIDGNVDGDEIEENPSVSFLDLTSFQLHDLDEIELSPSLIELDLTANRLSFLDSRISLLSHLKKLSLRQNLFDDAGIESISRFSSVSGLQVFNFFIFWCLFV